MTALTDATNPAYPALMIESATFSVAQQAEEVRRARLSESIQLVETMNIIDEFIQLNKEMQNKTGEKKEENKDARSNEERAIRHREAT